MKRMTRKNDYGQQIGKSVSVNEEKEWKATTMAAKVSVNPQA